MRITAEVARAVSELALRTREAADTRIRHHIEERTVKEKHLGKSGP